jgi:hypothetical protein
MDRDDGGYAFPVNTQNAEAPGSCFPDPGMTLRDYFAAKAMAALIADRQFVLGYDPNQVADRAYGYADAMLAERKKGA